VRVIRLFLALLCGCATLVLLTLCWLKFPEGKLGCAYAQRVLTKRR
jgi:hypothetical protein